MMTTEVIIQQLRGLITRIRLIVFFRRLRTACCSIHFQAFDERGNRSNLYD